MQANFGNNDVTIKVGLVQGSDNIKQQAKKKGQQAGKQFQQGFSGASKGVSAFGGATSQLGKFAKLLSGTSALFAGIGITFSAVIDSIGQYFDKLILTTQEKVSKLKSELDFTQKESGQHAQQASDYVAIFEQLERLQKQQSLTDEELNTAIKIVTILEDKYGSLGITVDTTSKKIIGLAEASKKLNTQNNTSAIRDAEKELAIMKEKINMQREDTFNKMTNKGIVGGAIGKLKNFFGIENDTFESEAYQKLNAMTAEQQLLFFKNFRDATNSGEDIKLIDQMIVALQERIQLEKKLQSLRQYGATSQKEYVNNLGKNLENSATNANQKALQKLQDMQKKQQEKNSPFGAFENLNSDLQKVTKNITQAEQKLSELRKNATGDFNELKIAETEKYITQQKIKQLEIQSKLNDIQRKQQKGIENQARSLLDQLLVNDKQYQISKKIRSLEQSSGGKLSDSQIADIRGLFDYSEQFKKLQDLRSTWSRGFETRTNELTARGGFAGGASVSDTEFVNKQIRDYSSQTARLVADIRQILQRGGVI